LVPTLKEFAQAIQYFFYGNRTPLGPGPDDDADEVEEDAFRDRRDYYTLAEAAILRSMEPEMRGWFYTTEPNLVIGDLKHHFESQVRLMVYDRLNEFYALKMEEHTSVGLHIAKMHGIYTVRQKGLAVTGVFSPTLMIEASIADLQPLVMCIADC
jgi:hypothetical protein